MLCQQFCGISSEPSTRQDMWYVTGLMGFDAAYLWHHSGAIRNLGQDATVFCLKGKPFPRRLCD